MDEQDSLFMWQAIELAKAAEKQGEVPVGALLVDDTGRVVGQGSNQPISACDPSAHAEIIAIRDAAKKLDNYRLPKTTLYVTIEPCTMCFGAIIHARIGRVVFGAPEPKAGVLVSHPELMQSMSYNHAFDWLGGVLEKECADLMSSFFTARRALKARQKVLN